MPKDDSKTTDAVVDTAPADDAVAAKLKEFGATDDIVTKVKVLGVKAPGDIAELEVSDLTAAGLSLVDARKLLKSFAVSSSKAETDASASASDLAAAATLFDSVLPQLPEDDALLAALTADGKLKVDRYIVVAATRVALADRAGMFGVDKKLLDALEQYSKESGLPIDEIGLDLYDEMTRRTNPEIANAIPGFKRRYATKARKDELFQNLDRYLWPAIAEFQGQLNAWRSGFGDGIDMVGLMSMSMARNAGAPLPPDLMMEPPTDGIQDAARSVNTAINKCFSGFGVYVTAAIAADATDIKRRLEDPRLPAQVGAADYEQMLKKLGIDIPVSYARLERLVARFIVSILDFAEKSTAMTTEEESMYVRALFSISRQITWDQLGVRQLGTGSLSRLGGRSGTTARELGGTALRVGSTVKSYGAYDENGDAYKGGLR